ncbi:MAG: hypothetical protein LBM28_04820 [Oscillospiraceae bacterium]|jgi:hypothetical protein|nr:hypothetical protein [Oscillospiraceae bacterium]
MKRIFALLLVLCTLFAGCAEKAPSVEVNLSKMSSTVAYAQLTAMKIAPQEYFGKQVSIRGQFATYQASDAAGNPVPGQVYFACLISDVTACCSQDLEFVPADGSLSYPEDYPAVGSLIAITGEFQSYEEAGLTYYRLVNAKFT